MNTVSTTVPISVSISLSFSLQETENRSIHYYSPLFRFLGSGEEICNVFINNFLYEVRERILPYLEKESQHFSMKYPTSMEHCVINV